MRLFRLTAFSEWQLHQEVFIVSHLVTNYDISLVAGMYLLKE